MAMAIREADEGDVANGGSCFRALQIGIRVISFAGALYVGMRSTRKVNVLQRSRSHQRSNRKSDVARL